MVGDVAGEDGEFSGACHCGRLQVRFTTLLATERLVPRACDCSFCQKHGAAYVSDPRGTLRLTVPAGLVPYRQGAGNGQFHVCDRCGVLVAVTFENEAGRRFGTVNVRCLTAAEQFPPPQPASPQTLPPEERTARWRQLWVPDVDVQQGPPAP
jgi:hypothetical protein